MKRSDWDFSGMLIVMSVRLTFTDKLPKVNLLWNQYSLWSNFSVAEDNGEFKKLRRQLQRNCDIKIELCVKLSLLRLFHVDHVVQNRRIALSLAWYEWFSCKGKECVTPRFKPFCLLEFSSVGKHRQLECQRHHHKLKFHWPNEEKQAYGALDRKSVV